MKKALLGFFAVCIGSSLSAQKIEFEEYTLNNGLTVILHQDNSAPVVTTAVMYDVGAKDEDPERTGFAHFFEHLLFEGTKNIGRGEWFKLVSAQGGSNNANTNQDRTYYYEIFPSNSLELGLWMESERMLHPVIDQVGVDTQNEVVKEEKRQRYDAPYGRVFELVSKNLFDVHPYKGTTIGEMEHLDAATLDEFLAFNQKWYIPNNAALVVTGDFQKDNAKQLIQKYFGDIPAGKKPVRNFPKEKPIEKPKKVTHYDPFIQLPLLLNCYRTPANNEKDSYVLNMISTLLTDGQSSRLYKKLVDEDKSALQIFAQNIGQVEYGMYFIGALPQGENTLEDLDKKIDAEVKKLQTELISEKEYQKLQNIMEDNFVNSNSSMAGIASSLATYNMLYGDTNLINDQINIYRSISREDIRSVAKKYLNPYQKVQIEYLPKPEEKK